MNLQSCSPVPFGHDAFVEKAGLHSRKALVNSIKPSVIYLPSLGIWRKGQIKNVRFV